MNLRAFVVAIPVASVIVLAGCSVGPDYVRPDTPAPKGYKEMEGWKTATPQDQIKRGAWWEAFGDEQLNALEKQAAQHNQDLAAAEAQYRQAMALVSGARAGYYPTVGADVGISRAGPSTAPRSGTEHTATLSAQWELDLWGRVRRTVEANKAGAEASAADLESARLSVQAQLAQDYVQLRVLDRQKQLLDDAADNYEKTLQLTQNQYAVGVVSKADVMQAQTQLKTTQAQALDLGVSRAQLEHAIAVLTGVAPAGFSIAAAPLVLKPPDIPVGVPSVLLERRPDIAAAERRAAAANAQIGVARSAYFPDLTLSGSGTYQSPNVADWFTLPNRVWLLGAELAETIFDAGARKAKADQAVAAYDQSAAQYRSAVLNGFADVEDALAQLRVLEQEAQVQNDAVAAAEESAKLVMNQYKAGTVSYLNVVVAQNAALSNERAALNVLSQRLTASIALVKALGGGWTGH